jgi:lipopolysaccharide biosynthesis protein
MRLAAPAKTSAVPWVERSPAQKRQIIEEAATAALMAGGPGAGTGGGGTEPAGPLRCPRLIAFYLPQFHQNDLNDEWWGEGFTEWTRVRQAQPNYAGHRQPVEPGELGYYDLSDPTVMDKQAALARAYGIHGFCFYYYWFGGGRRMLEQPLEQFAACGRPDLPFCICWANDTWTRTWDGRHHEVLMPQEYPPGFAEEFMQDVLPLLKDERYLRVDGAPLLLVYRPNLLPDAPETVRLWRAVCRRQGIPDLHLAMVQNYEVADPRVYGFDAAVEFPPNVRLDSVLPGTFPGIAPDFTGRLMDYAAMAARLLAKAPQPFLHYRGVTPAWDNTPRRNRLAHILVGSSPELYRLWLEKAVEITLARSPAQQPLLFVNAWNEWGEGAYLEPDGHEGRARLQATRAGLVRGIRAHLRRCGVDLTEGEVVKALVDQGVICARTCGPGSPGVDGGASS